MLRFSPALFPSVDLSRPKVPPIIQLRLGTGSGSPPPLLSDGRPGPWGLCDHSAGGSSQGSSAGVQAVRRARGMYDGIDTGCRQVRHDRLWLPWIVGPPTPACLNTACPVALKCFTRECEFLDSIWPVGVLPPTPFCSIFRGVKVRSALCDRRGLDSTGMPGGAA